MCLFIHQAALGDFVLTFPILRAIKPQPTLVVAPGEKARLAARLFPHVQPIDIESHGWSNLHAPNITPDATPAPLIANRINIRRVISFVSTGHDDWAHNIRALTPNATHHFISPRPPDGMRIHVADWHRQQLGELLDA